MPIIAGDRLRRADWVVRPVDIVVARRLVELDHYAAGAANTGVYLHGLFHIDAFFDGECQGVAWWLPPTKPAALAAYPANWQGVLSLSRLAISAGVPANACSFLLGRSMRLIDRGRWPCLITYADEWRGHTGAIYRATNWSYAGMTKPERTYVRNGRMVARKAGKITRTTAQMAAIGAVCVGAFAKHRYRHIVI